MKALDLNNLVLRQLTILEAVTERFVTIAVAKKQITFLKRYQWKIDFLVK